MKILTVIVPTYNMEMYLDKCLTSLILPDQSLMDQLEVLVVNDGSKDRSSEIAHGYESRYPNTFKVIDKQNGNYGSCINAALPVSAGRYVKVLDADDWFDTANFIRYITFLISKDVDMIITDYCKVDKNDKIISANSWRENLPIERDLTLEDLCKIGMPANFQMHAVTYRTRNLIEIKYQQTEGISYTDVEWVFAPIKTVNKVAYFSHNIYMYLCGREGQTVDVEVFKRKFNDVKIVFKSIIHAFSTIEEKSPSHFFLAEKLASHCNFIIYRNIFVGVFTEEQCRSIDIEIKKEYPQVYKEMDNYLIEIKGQWLPLKYWRRHLLWLFCNPIYRKIADIRVRLGLRSKFNHIMGK